MDNVDDLRRTHAELKRRLADLELRHEEAERQYRRERSRLVDDVRDAWADYHAAKRDEADRLEAEAQRRREREEAEAEERRREEARRHQEAARQQRGDADRRRREKKAREDADHLKTVLANLDAADRTTLFDTLWPGVRL